MIAFNTGCTVKKAAVKQSDKKTVQNTVKKIDNSGANKSAGPENIDSQDKNQVNTDKSTKEEESAATTAPNDNEIIGWGLGLNDEHKTPDIPKTWQTMLDKYNGMFIGDTTKKNLYLTFDEGYEAGNTGNILDTLKSNNVKAAFFITGHFVDTDPDLVKRMIKEGHIVGNHTENHPSLPTISNDKIKEELSSVQEKVSKIANYNMKYVRPPKGEFNERTMECVNSLGFKTVFWSFAMGDWQPLAGGSDEAYNTLMKYVHPGSIILLHAISNDDTQALDRMIKSLKSQGYTFRPLTDIK